MKNRLHYYLLFSITILNFISLEGINVLIIIQTGLILMKAEEEFSSVGEHLSWPDCWPVLLSLFLKIIYEQKLEL